MLPITAYADRYSVAPGQTIAFKVSSAAADDYEADVFIRDETVTLIGRDLVLPADRIIDAAGRPLPSLRVEFLEAFQGQPLGVPLQAQLTDGRGAWSFSGVPAGDYVVRMVDRDRTVGVPVSVAESSGATGVLIVAPSLPPPARISMAQGAAAGAGGVSTAAIVVGTAAAAAAAAVVVVVVRDES
jgi:hypothetical protein